MDCFRGKTFLPGKTRFRQRVTMRIPSIGRAAVVCLSLFLPAACTMASQEDVTRTQPLPVMRWDHRPESANWTRATLAAVQAHGGGLVATVPDDINHWCPGYESADTTNRAAFWVGLFSTLAKYESTWNPAASGGGGKWIGLTQIDPRTARGYGCVAQDVASLKDGAANLSCAVRIAAVQVSRDDALITDAGGSWRGVARDWAPFRSAAKREDMAAWTRSQSYCKG